MTNEFREKIKGRISSDPPNDLRVKCADAGRGVQAYILRALRRIRERNRDRAIANIADAYGRLEILYRICNVELPFEEYRSSLLTAFIEVVEEKWEDAVVTLEDLSDAYMGVERAELA